MAGRILIYLMLLRDHVQDIVEVQSLLICMYGEAKTGRRGSNKLEARDSVAAIGLVWLFRFTLEKRKHVGFKPHVLWY